MDDIFKKVDKLVGDKIVDIIGDPPCQSYSVVGRIRDPQNMKNDPCNFLYKYYIYFLKRYAPEMFVFENVPGILPDQNGVHFENIRKGAKEAGYTVDCKKLKASDFGMLQHCTKKDCSYRILPDLFFDLLARQQGEENLIETVKYSAPATEYLQIFISEMNLILLLNMLHVLIIQRIWKYTDGRRIYYG